jgi:hypothetical protein
MANIKTIIINNDYLGLERKNCNNVYDWDITIDSQQYLIIDATPTPDAISDDHAELIDAVFADGGLNHAELEYTNDDISKVTIDLDIPREFVINTTTIEPEEY